MIKILCVGKIKEVYINQLIHDYRNRIQKYHNIEIIEVKDCNDLEKEKIFLLKHLLPRDYIITLEILGNRLTSEQFSELIDSTFVHHPCITFVIGSSIGIHEDIKKMSHYSITFSDMTFPHGLFRGILLEQIYRSFKIINHETYHK